MQPVPHPWAFGPADRLAECCHCGQQIYGIYTVYGYNWRLAGVDDKGHPVPRLSEDTCIPGPGHPLAMPLSHEPAEE
ncbi:hypothetical protein C1I98_28575 [Spongiactinospora gelatinilytica]|uniref:Uncharacterized protein n=1 Tax=Spongiactinospora gelatinilytica TaxID=2666298 RepID=A0A2W2F8Z2_9ACTN|nr:hypothetical protein [Spongiactinospora gelatinilytica]PZG33716.1 hypothetical protein C1I98_28575 [Spongiactinospora gelatinilytica]